MLSAVFHLMLIHGGFIMLYEIVCENFKQKRIEFHPGLNTVLGDGSGSNSIGKSTFLMIIDFVFGGTDYVQKSTDVQRNVGNHEIKFCFIFNKKYYYFSRNTYDSDIIFHCDKDYNHIKSDSLKNYLSFLQEQYSITIPDVTFRGVVSRYIRVYGRDNINEKRPLNIVSNEAAGEPTIALLKLFDLYHSIAELELLARKKKDELSSFRKAQRLSYIPKIGKTQYNKNKEKIKNLYEEESMLTSELGSGIIDIDSILTDEIINSKKELSILRRQRSKILSQLSSINQNIIDNKPQIKQDYSALLEFFPNVNIKHIEEIEQFHLEISEVLKSELREEKKHLENLLNELETDIGETESNLKSIPSANLSKIVLQKHSNIIKEIEQLSQENARYDQEEQISSAAQKASDRAKNMRIEQLSYLQNIINQQMAKINDFIYNGRKIPPTLTFNDLQYNFHTRDDTGTGTCYKGLVVYDLSVLELTQLPFLVHDSVVLKQIADEAIENILKKYQQIGKQVFISLDKAPSYTDAATQILTETKVLSLSNNGNELFGRSWSEK